MEFKKGLYNYVIHLPQTHSDRIKLASGLELFVDPDWNPKDHRILVARLVVVPKQEKLLKVGDVVHFHPNVVNNDGFNLGGGYYYIPYNEERSMIPAYEHPENGFTPLFNYLYVKQEDEQKLKFSGLDLGALKRQKGTIAFMSEKCKELLPCEIGDEINYRALRSFTTEVNGEDYVRLLSKDVNFVYAKEKEEC